MGQYTEGQLLHGSDGKLYVVRNGVPVTAGAQPLVANPKLPGEVMGQSLSNQRTQQEIDAANAQAGYDTRIKAAQARQEEIKAANANFEGGDALGDPKLTGAARLASVPDSQRPLVQLLLNNQLSQLGAFSLKSPQMQSLLSTAKAIDPTFDPSLFGARYKGITDFTGEGKGAQAVAAVNRLGANLQALKAISDKMGGPNLGFSPLNSVVAGTEQQFEPKLRAAYDALLPEIANQFDLIMKSNKGSPTVSGIDEVMNGLKRGQSQVERDAAMQQVVKAVHGAIAPLRAQWDSAYGGNTPPPMWISPEAAKFFSSIDPEDANTYKYEQHPLPGLRGDTTPPGTPPSSGNQPPLAGFAPPPSGPGSGGPTNGGFNDKPDPQSAAFWERAASSGQPYRQALSDWRSLVAQRGLTAQEPPPPGAYGKVSRYMQAHPNIEYHPFQSVERTPMTIGDRILNGTAQSGPAALGVHAANSALANVPGLVIGPDKMAYFNQVSNQQHGFLSPAGDLAGTVAGAIGTGKALDAVAPSLGIAGKFLTKNAARTALSGDVAFGGASGAAQNPDNPFLGAAGGAGAMALGNIAGRYALGPLIRAGGSAAGKLGMFAPPRALTTPESMIFGRADPVFGDIRSNLQDASNLGLPYSLADADPRLRVLAGSAARKSPDVRALAENTFGPRQTGQGERAIAQINSNLAPVGDVPTIMADARARAQAASKPLYAAALAHPAPQDAKLNEMLDTPAGQTAARNAYGIALNAGENPAELSFSTGPDGQPIINANPNWKTLQYVKMGLDKVVTDNQNPVTGKLDLSDPANRAINDLRGRFVMRLGELNSDYKDANQAYQGIIGQGSAAQRGAVATSPKVTPEQAQIAVTNAGSNLPYFQRGYASDMADQVERSRLSGNPYNLIYGSMGQRAKIGSIFPQGASAFDRANALEGDMSKTGTELFGGSQTQPRAEADKLFDNPIGDTATDLAFGLATGVPPPSLIRRGLGTFARDNLRLGAGAKSKADQLGPLLLNPDPAASLQTLDDLQRYALLRKGYVNQTNAYGGMFGAPLIYSAPSALGLGQN